MLLRIHNSMFNRTKDFMPGEGLVFGRFPRDVGQLAENALVSRQHGVVKVTDDGFTVTSTGTYNGFVVRDHTTPSRLYIPRGVGPVEVPFAEASITFDHSVPGQLHLQVMESETANRWRRRWAPELEQEEMVHEELRRRAWKSGHGMRTQPPPGLRRKANNEPYTWFWTLVAMCENDITGEQAGVPTNANLAARLGYDVHIIERHVQSIYEALELRDRNQARRRDAAVRSAIERGLVSRNDLRSLRNRHGG